MLWCKHTWLSLAYLVLHFELAAAVCYYPDSSVSPQDTACSNTGENSTCCGQGYACLSNNICMATGDEIKKPGASLYVRGSCTDPTWRSNNCPLFCIDPNVDLLSGGMGIAKCPNTTEDEYYCIDGNDDNTNCISETNVLIFQGTPSVLTTIGVTATSSTTTSSSSTTTSSSSTIATISTSTPPTLPASPTSPTASASSSTSSSSASLSSQPADHTVAIAVGIAVPLIVIIFALLAWILVRQRRQKDKVAAATAPPRLYHDSSNGGQYPLPTYYEPTSKPELQGSQLGGEINPPHGDSDVRYELPGSGLGG